MAVLVYMRRLFFRSPSICVLSCFFLWRVVLAFKVSFLTYVVFLMVFSLWSYVLSKVVFMGSVAFKLPFYSMCCFPTRFHGGYCSSFNFLSVLLLSFFLSIQCFQVAVCRLQVSFLSVCHLQVVFMERVAFQLAVSGMCRFHSSFMVIFLFCAPFSFIACLLTTCFHGVCHLPVFFMTSATFKLAHS